MSLTPGTRLGSYEVAAQIGAGGMGEVYRATDTALGRQVAIKILPGVFAQDAERLARFEREARTLASLNHPNIAIIHGFERSHGASALVMELVEGPTLADRIARGPLELDEALPIAKQIAEALEAAHEQGIIHRDLKPANVKVKVDGTVKVLDFGLAKAFEPAAVESSMSHSPTITSPAMTGVGVLLGTAAYMSPEQARGKRVDRRADIWAFGCVLYEMLTGRRTFEGEDVSVTLADVIRAEPRWDLLPPGVPTTLRTYLKRCLEKDPRQRVRDIGDMRLALTGAFNEIGTVGVDSHPARHSTKLTAVASLLLGALIGGAALFWAIDRSPSAANRPVTRFSVTLAPGRAFAQTVVDPIAITPDGQRIVFSAVDSVRSGTAAGRLYSRPLDQLEAAPIPGGEGPVGSLFLSPDGELIAFNRSTGDSVFRKLPVRGGVAATVTQAVVGNYGGATWGASGAIVFAVNSGIDGLSRAIDSGGSSEPLTRPPEGESHLHPHFLPDGERLLYTRRRVDQADQIAVLDPASATSRDLIQGMWPRYAPSGHLLFVREGVLWATALDLTALEVRGTPAPVVEGISNGRLSFSTDGTLVYVPLPPTTGTILTWVDRDGATVPLPLESGDYWLPRLSPDGGRLAVGIAGDIWAIDLERRGRNRLTFGQTARLFPFTWSPDGRYITFASAESNRIYRIPADGSGEPEVLLEGKDPQWPTAWSPDGRDLAFYVNAPKTTRDLWILTPGPDATPRLFLGTQFQERSAQFSPDGRWLAYVSNESGRNEVYVRPYPGPGGQVAISTNGGTQPVWSRAGGELFYRSGGAVLVVDVQTGASLRVGAPRALFESEEFLLETGGVGGNASYDVSPDGKRFLMLAGTPVPTDVRVVLNWFEELKRLVPVD